MPMSILASVCWKAGSVWLCCGRVCGIPRVVAWWCCGVLRVVARVCARVRVCPRACVVARVGVFVWLRAWVCVGGPRLCARPPPGGVLWRFPTLPHPLGCSTIGAAGLSFQVRNVAGRFPGAVTTTSLCRPPVLARRLVWRGVLARGLVWRGGGWVGRGSYSGCGCFVPPSSPFFLVGVPCPCLWARRGVGGVWLPAPLLVGPVLRVRGWRSSSLWRC